MAKRALNISFERRKITPVASTPSDFPMNKPPQSENAQRQFEEGNALMAKGQIQQAINSYEAALSARAHFPEAMANLGIALALSGRFEDSVAALRQAMAQKPDLARAHDAIGTSLRFMGQAELAIPEHRKAIELEPSFTTAYFNLGLDLLELGRNEDAVRAFRRALAISPGFKDLHTSILCQMHFLWPHDPRAIYEEHRRWNRTFAQPLAPLQPLHGNDPDPERRLRVGYVSADFRQHSVSFFFEDLLAKHDPRQVEVYCYADEVKPDEVTDRLRRKARNWRAITGQSDQAVAEMIVQDGIDILVDLAGHTGGNRLLVFARKPAPIQVSYLGYIGSTGLDAMDYRITDALLDPPGTTEQFHCEQLLRLPSTFACYRPPIEAPPIGALPAISNGYITFGSFTTIQKLNATLLHCWAKILSRVSRSRIIIGAKGLGYTSVKQSIHGIFKRHGVAADRVELLDEQSFSDYLAAHQRVDVLLDTFPVNGHTVTCHAIWMGVPAVSLAGPTYCQRLGTSVLTNLGFEELVGQTPSQYEKIAVGLANDLPRLIEFRQTIRSRMTGSGLMDSSRFAQDMENVFRTIWRQWCRNHELPKT
jgi:protein O-GlcNAc transferase